MAQIIIYIKFKHAVRHFCEQHKGLTVEVKHLKKIMYLYDGES